MSGANQGRHRNWLFREMGVHSARRLGTLSCGRATANHLISRPRKRLLKQEEDHAITRFGHFTAITWTKSKE